jgi:hypothetical protein
VKASPPLLLLLLQAADDDDDDMRLARALFETQEEDAALVAAATNGGDWNKEGKRQRSGSDGDVVVRRPGAQSDLPAAVMASVANGATASSSSSAAAASASPVDVALATLARFLALERAHLAAAADAAAAAGTSSIAGGSNSSSTPRPLDAAVLAALQETPWALGPVPPHPDPELTRSFVEAGESAAAAAAVALQQPRSCDPYALLGHVATTNSLTHRWLNIDPNIIAAIRATAVTRDHTESNGLSVDCIAYEHPYAYEPDAEREAADAAAEAASQPSFAADGSVTPGTPLQQPPGRRGAGWLHIALRAVNVNMHDIDVALDMHSGKGGVGAGLADANVVLPPPQVRGCGGVGAGGTVSRG